MTLSPRASRIAANEAAAIPLPKDETTPPVTNINLDIVWRVRLRRHRQNGNAQIDYIFYTIYLFFSMRFYNFILILIMVNILLDQPPTRIAHLTHNLQQQSVHCHKITGVCGHAPKEE